MQGLKLLQGAAPAMQMGARERAVYLRKAPHMKSWEDEGVKEEEEATLTGNNIAALRAWVRQVLLRFACSASFSILPVHICCEGLGFVFVLRPKHQHTLEITDTDVPG